MSEATEASSTDDSSTGNQSTGNAEVDAVVASILNLDSAELEEHLPIFEQAHEALRAALSKASDAS